MESHDKTLNPKNFTQEEKRFFLSLITVLSAFSAIIDLITPAFESIKSGSTMYLYIIISVIVLVFSIQKLYSGNRSYVNMFNSFVFLVPSAFVLLLGAVLYFSGSAIAKSDSKNEINRGLIAQLLTPLKQIQNMVFDISNDVRAVKEDTSEIKIRTISINDGMENIAKMTDEIHKGVSQLVLKCSSDKEDSDCVITDIICTIYAPKGKIGSDMPNRGKILQSLNARDNQNYRIDSVIFKGKESFFNTEGKGYVEINAMYGVLNVKDDGSWSYTYTAEDSSGWGEIEKFSYTFLDNEGVRINGRIEIGIIGKDLIGTENPDVFYGGTSNNPQIFRMRDGNDHIEGRNGPDTIYGGKGNDRIYGDTKFGEDASYSGNNNKDRLFGEEGDDFIDGGSDDDELFGGNGNDNIYGWEGNDKIICGNGDDLCAGEHGNDVLTGGEGKDVFFVTKNENGKDTITDFSIGEDKIYIHKELIKEIKNISFVQQRNGIMLKIIGENDKEVEILLEGIVGNDRYASEREIIAESLSPWKIR